MNELQNAATGGKNQDRTRNSVLRQMALLQSMSLEQLREKWLDLYGEEPPRYKKQLLIKRLAYRIQELFYGGLSEQAVVEQLSAVFRTPTLVVKTYLMYLSGRASDLVRRKQRIRGQTEKERREDGENRWC